MNAIINFITDTKSVIFGLFALMFGLFYIYASNYFYINPLGNYQYLHLTISLVVAFGFATSTIILIVHNKNENTPFWFAFFDFFGYALYYSNSALDWWNKAEYAKIGSGVFISFLSAFIVFKFGEIFITEVKDKFKEAKLIDKLKQDFEKKQNELWKRINEEEDKYQKEFLVANDLRSQVQKLQTQNVELNNSYQAYKIDFERVINDNLELSGKINQLEKEKQVFEIDNSPEYLKKSLTGLKASFTRAINENRLDTAHELLGRMQAVASMLGIELEGIYENQINQKSLNGVAYAD